jgi:hypothetical protein
MHGTRAAFLPLFLPLEPLLPSWTCVDCNSRLKTHQHTPGTSVQPLSPSCSASIILRVWNAWLWYGTNLPPRYCAAWAGPDRKGADGQRGAPRVYCPCRGDHSPRIISNPFNLAIYHPSPVDRGKAGQRTPSNFRRSSHFPNRTPNVIKPDVNLPFICTKQNTPHNGLRTFAILGQHRFVYIFQPRGL